MLCVGGSAYVGLEKVWRGHSHWSMFVVGGLCFHAIGAVDKKMAGKSRTRVCLASAAVITAVEFVSGCVLNRWLKLNVWDYSKMPLNVKGQICLPYTILWLGLSAAAVPLYRALNQKG